MPIPTFTITPFTGGVTEVIPTKIDAVTNYVYTMCGAYAFEALGIIGSGGGVVPSPSGGGGTGLIPYSITVTISASQAGSKTLTNTNWIGLQDVNLVTINQSSFQSGAQFTFSPLTGTFDFSLSGYTLQKNDVLTSLGFYTP